MTDLDKAYALNTYEGWSYRDFKGITIAHLTYLNIAIKAVIQNYHGDMDCFFGKYSIELRKSSNI